MTNTSDFDTLYYETYHWLRFYGHFKTRRNKGIERNPGENKNSDNFKSIPSRYTLQPPLNLTQIKGGLLLPFQGLCKGFCKTITKYKSLYHLIYDSMQPTRGGINIIEGIVHLTAGTGRLLILPLLYLISAVSTMPCFNNSYKKLESVNRHYRRLLNFSLSWILYGLTNSIRGIIQIVTTPLTLAIKMPLRILITLGTGIYRILKGGKLSANNSFNNTSIGNNGPPQRRSSGDFYQQSIPKQPANKTGADTRTSTHIILSGISNWLMQGFAKRLSFKYFKPKKTRKDEKQTPRVNYYFPYQYPNC